MIKTLTKQEKDAIGILSIGTFLEYFDLLLYIHMITLLNNIFFAQSDKASTALLAAFAYCINYAVRPLASILIGWLGDTKGRKFVIQLTLYMTALSSMIIFLLPPYAAIGVTASVLITLCRIMQSFSSMGEVIGAEIYVTELIKGKMQYIALGCIVVLAMFGSLLALVVAHYATLEIINWRYAFLLGGIIAVVGSQCRSKLKETFKLEEDNKQLTCATMSKMIFNSFLMQNLHVICWYVSFIYCSDILRNKFGYNDSEVITNNLKLTLTILASCIAHTLLFIKYSPLSISKIRNYLMLGLVIISPRILADATEPLHILLLQCGFMLLGANEIAAIAIRVKNIPRSLRFRTESILGSLSGLIVALICTLGINLLKDYLGNYTFLVFLLPFTLMYHFGLKYFAELDKSHPDGCHVNYAKVQEFEESSIIVNENVFKKRRRGRPNKNKNKI